MNISEQVILLEASKEEEKNKVVEKPIITKREDVYCGKQGHVQADCPTKQSHEQNGNGQHTNDVACCSRIDSSEASGREHNSAQTVQHALSTNRR